MNPWARELECYLTIRRSLGYALRADERILRRFIAFADQEGATHLSTALFLRWQETCGHATRHTWAQRLGIIRRFAQWLHGLDPQHEVPPPTVIPSGYRRARPYIYSDDDLRCIVQTAAALPSLNGLRATQADRTAARSPSRRRPRAGPGRPARSAGGRPRAPPPPPSPPARPPGWPPAPAPGTACRGPRQTLTSWQWDDPPTDLPSPI